MPNVPISTNSSGPTRLVAAPTGNRFIRVLGYKVIAGGSVLVKFQSGATDLTGADDLGAGTGSVAPVSVEGWFDTNIGDDLNINLSAGVQVSGHLKYAIQGG
jgi:hypothetical protein